LKAITRFADEYSWLSNFWQATVTLDGVTYPTVENAYQAAKTFPSQRNKFRHCTPGAAKREGRVVTMRPEWLVSEDVKVGVMRDLLRQKFANGKLIALKLVATKDVHLQEGNDWGDKFWGVYRGAGQNMLGKLLMEQRAYLQNLNQEHDHEQASEALRYPRNQVGQTVDGPNVQD
jgi:ribA/ribD-fused uncharacterized protein